MSAPTPARAARWYSVLADPSELVAVHANTSSTLPVASST
jgi:hypothetical protein